MNVVRGFEYSHFKYWCKFVTLLPENDYIFEKPNPWMKNIRLKNLKLMKPGIRISVEDFTPMIIRSKESTHTLAAEHVL